MSELVQGRQRDELFNSDLIYKIRKLAGFKIPEDEVTEERIRMRMQSLPEIIDGKRLEVVSYFHFELVYYCMQIGKKAGILLGSLKEISVYPELVKEVLMKIETNEILAHDDLALILKIKVSEHAFNSDLIYKISRLAGFGIPEDEVAEERIRMRMRSLPVKKDDGIHNIISPFMNELYSFVMEIGEKAEVVFANLDDISAYPELVKEALKQYEEQDAKQQGDKQISIGTYPSNSESNC